MRASLGCVGKGSMLPDEMSKSDKTLDDENGAALRRVARNAVVSDA